MMFSSNHSGDQKYSQLGADSDSDSSGDHQDDFIQREIRNQKMMMKQQDQGLEMLGQSAERLSQISMGIHEELGHQDKMLNEMEDDLDTADANLNLVTAKTKQLIQQSGGKRNFAIIVVLSIVVVVLFFLILYS